MMFWKGINQYRSISSMSTCYYLSGFYTPCVRRCVLTTSLVAKEDYSLQVEASIFVWERLWYSISLCQQEISHCAGCKKMLRWRASSKFLLIKRRSASWILMTLLLRKQPPKANWYVLNCFEYLCYDVFFKSIYLHNLFFTSYCVILAKSYS